MKDITEGDPTTKVTRTKVVMIDDDRDFAEEYIEFLSSDLDVTYYEAATEDPREIIEDTTEAVLLDIDMPKIDGLDFLKRVRGAGLDIPVIMLTHHADSQMVVSALKAGASHFVPKDRSPSYLREILAHELTVRRAQLRAEHDRYLSDVYRDGDPDGQMAGKSPAIQAMRQVTARLAERRVDVLITGESGVGKEVVAREIYARSKVKGLPFQVVSLPDIPGTLFESVLFGHEKGAFTGAFCARAGAFEAVGEGDLFLDEIGELPLKLQTTLLRVLESRTYNRAGGTTEYPFRGRVIAATNRDLTAEVAADRFRNDLYHRLCTFPIEVPPLRDRPEDILPIAHYLLEREASRLDLPVRGFSEETLEYLKTQEWADNNIRELCNAIRAALVHCDGDTLERHHFIDVRDPVGRMKAMLRALETQDESAKTAAASPVTPAPDMPAKIEDDHEVVADTEAAEGTAGPVRPPAFLTWPFSEAKRGFEAAYVDTMQAAADGVVNEAARNAALDPSYFRRLMRRAKNWREDWREAWR